MRHEPAHQLLFRAVSQPELDAIAAAAWLAFPPPRAAAATFYLAPPADADLLAEAATGPTAHYLVRVAVDADYLLDLLASPRGGPATLAISVPAGQLAAFNAHISGQIDVVRLLAAS